jgi:two-component system CheB/CheR fusion protein
MSLWPYRTRDILIDGVVVTFVDISDRIKPERAMITNLLSFGETIAHTAREPFLILDGDLMVTTANSAFYRAFKVSPDETEGRRINELGNRQWDIPNLKELLEQVIPPHAVLSDFEVKHTFPTIGPKTMLLNARPFQSDRQKFILLAIEDVTPAQGREGPTPTKPQGGPGRPPP